MSNSPLSTHYNVSLYINIAYTITYCILALVFVDYREGPGWLSPCIIKSEFSVHVSPKQLIHPDDMSFCGEDVL